MINLGAPLQLGRKISTDPNLPSELGFYLIRVSPNAIGDYLLRQ
jgi:hypothetical protein